VGFEEGRVRERGQSERRHMGKRSGSYFLALIG
jgi:hypothetical protein